MKPKLNNIKLSLILQQVGEISYIYRTFHLITTTPLTLKKKIKNIISQKREFHSQRKINMTRKNVREYTGISEDSFFNFLQENNSRNSLKLITLSIGNVSHKDLDFTLEFAIRSVTNFLDRVITKKSVRKASSAKVANSKSSFITRRTLSKLSGKSLKELIQGGIYKVEFATCLGDFGKYNAHVHILCEAEYIPQTLLSSIWLDVLSKPFKGVKFSADGIVDIRSVRNSEASIRKTFRYMVKPIPVMRNKKHQYSRLLSKFGTWYNSNLLSTT